MTKVQRHYQVDCPIDDRAMEQIARINSVYGIERVRIERSGRLLVEYDATRLSQAGVSGVLEHAGLPVTEVSA